MIPFLIVLVLIICVLMVFVILAQNPKGSGLSSQFGGSGATQLIGAKRTTDLLEKVTWGMCIAVFVLCFAANALLDQTATAAQQGYRSPNLENVNTGSAPLIPEANPSLDDATPVPAEDPTPAQEEEE
ncbi:MAG: preprotein translocase subunit SecG [Bernardetiaceae bacterium]